jgi:preprotein translocase subunit Sec63
VVSRQQQPEPSRTSANNTHTHRGMSQRCYYSILGISKTATADDVKKAYKDLALKWHPDKNLDNTLEAGERFKEMQEAVYVLLVNVVPLRLGLCC